MRIYVCVKQVPDTSGKVAVNEDGTLNRASMMTIINPDDMSAMEQALQIKDKTGCQVTAVTMEPPQAESMLRELMAVGADDSVLISSREFGGSDTYATSQIIAGALHHLGIGEDDLILCGRQAIDGDTAQVGPQIAEKLDIPQITYGEQLELLGKTVRGKRLLEDGYMTIEAELPCLVTCVKEMNTPRYLTVKGILKSYEKPIQVLDYNALKEEPLIDPDTIGLKGSPTNIFRSFTPPRKEQGRMLSGSGREAVRELISELTASHVIG